MTEDLVVSLIDSILRALKLAGTRDRHDVILAVRDRIYAEQFNRRNLGITPIALEVFRRLEEAQIVRTDYPKIGVSQLEKAVNVQLTLVISRSAASHLNREALSRMARGRGDIFGHLAERFGQQHTRPNADIHLDFDDPSSDRDRGQFFEETSRVQSLDVQPAKIVDEPNANYALHDIFYATDRRPGRPGDFGKGRSDKLHLGRCKVSVPPGKSHHIGRVEPPWSWIV